jgi:hypothetical protein
MDRLSPPRRRVALTLAAGVLCVAFSAREAAAQEKEPGKLESVVKRRTQTTDEDLRKQLQLAPEIGLDQPGADLLYAPITKAGAAVKNLPPDYGPKSYELLTAKIKRPDLLFLPWLRGADSEIGKEKAEELHVLSVKLRDSLRKSVKAGDVRPDPEALRKLLTDDEWGTPAALPTITQMMQAENAAVRMLLIEMLAKIKGKKASVAIAKRAVFDLSAEVREKAVEALANRPAAEYTPVLYYAFRYPWAAAADHAAEAVVALQRADLTHELVKLLKEPSPNLPVKAEKGHVLNEVVRVNHLCNCMLCHAPSLAKDDLVRGSVPLPGEDPPPLYYQERTGLFVRADLTYLRQDFSVVQPVQNPGKWSGNQRYDYLLRARPLTKAEQTAFEKLQKDGKLPKTYPQQDAVLFALKEITGKDFGTTYDDWNTGLRKSPPPPPAKPDPQEKRPELVKTVIEVTAQFDPDTKTLTVTAVGQVPSGGWKDAKLARKAAKDPPQDGVYEYELTAVAPAGAAPQVLAKVKAVDLWENPPADLKGVRVLGPGTARRRSRSRSEPARHKFVRRLKLAAGAPQNPAPAAGLTRRVPCPSTHRLHPGFIQSG